MLRFWQLIGYRMGRRPLRLLLIGASIALVFAAVFTFPGPRPVTLDMPVLPQSAPVHHQKAVVVGNFEPDQQATAGPARFIARPPRLLHQIVPVAARGRRHVVVPVMSGDSIPTVALNAYIHAAILLRTSDRRCGITWEDLAGIGRVESDNGQTWGSEARVTRNGTLYPPILGPVLDGRDGMPAIPTTDRGVLEFNPVWSRAVGPMQFLPSTWYAYARSGSRDKVPDPENFYDATLTAGIYLCKNGGDLATATGLTNAIYAYNHSSYYVSVVRQWAHFYTAEGAAALLAAGVTLAPAGRGKSGSGKKGKKGPPSSRHGKVPGGTGHGGGAGSGSVSASASLAAAALDSDSAGTFSFKLRVYSGKVLLATGSASVNYPRRQATMSIVPKGAGLIRIRVVGSRTWVEFPAGLAAVTHTTVGTWRQLTPSLIGQIPPRVGGYFDVLTHDVVWSIAQLAAGTTRLVLAGPEKLNGVAVNDFVGPVNLILAIRRVPAAGADLGRIANLIRSQTIFVKARVDSDGLLNSEVLVLGRLPGVSAATTVDLSFSGYGRSVSVNVPITSTTTTTTTTSTTSTMPVTTSTSSSTTTTSPTSSTAVGTSSTTSGESGSGADAG